MSISIEHTKNNIVAALLSRPLFGAVDNTDGCGSFRIVCDYYLGGGKIKLRARGVKIGLLGLSLAHNQRD
jgi:hypothetical protein